MPPEILVPTAGPHAIVAYLGPELPALSATFIYEELLGLERRGVTVRPFTVRRPAHPAAGRSAVPLVRSAVALTATSRSRR